MVGVRWISAQRGPTREQLNRAFQARIGHFDDDVLGVLLAAACVTQPTVELVAGAVGTSVEQTMELLEGPENQGIVSIDGNSVRFSHPLLARGVYNHVGPARRRRMHRTLARLDPLPERRARHLALAAASADRETLLALDTAAKAARRRGAPAAAAELLDLAIGLGGDTPVRRLRAADNHFNAGDIDRAQAQLQQALKQLPPGPMRAIAQMTLSGIRVYHNNFGEAAELLEQVLDQVSANPTLLVPGHLSMVMAKLALGRLDESLWHADRAGDPRGGTEEPNVDQSCPCRRHHAAVWAGSRRGRGGTAPCLGVGEHQCRRVACLQRQGRACPDAVLDRPACRGQDEDARRPRPMRRTRG